MPQTPLTRRSLGLAVAGTSLLALAGFGLRTTSRAAEPGRALPVPAQDQAATTAESAVAVFAGGCFWGVQGVFQHVEGVTAAVSGYAGGTAASANYDQVSWGLTEHAEAVEITYDPRRISFGQLMQVHFSVAHDPTQLNRQGPDHGAHYRTAIFPRGEEQARLARAYIAQLDQARLFDAPIVTRIELEKPFYRAEEYHQDYMTRHPTQPYIVIHDLPKIAELRRLLPALYRETPRLVLASAAR